MFSACRVQAYVTLFLRSRGIGTTGLGSQIWLPMDETGVGLENCPNHGYSVYSYYGYNTPKQAIVACVSTVAQFYCLGTRNDADYLCLQILPTPSLLADLLEAIFMGRPANEIPAGL
jgi:hypothetical protein